MITGRDRAIVDLLDRTGGLDVPSLRLAMGISQTVIYRRLGRLDEHGMVKAVRPFRGTPALYIPTRRGLREVLGRGDLEPPSVSMTSYNHQVHVGRVAAMLDRAGVRWEASRVTRRHQTAAKAEGRIAEARRYALTLSWLERSHLPDALIWPSQTAESTEQPVAIEIELTLKSRHRMDEILDGYATHLGVCGVVYICSPDTHAAVSRAVEQRRREGVVHVTTVDDFGAADEAFTSLVAGGSAGAWIARHLDGENLSALERSLRRAAARSGDLTIPGI